MVDLERHLKSLTFENERLSQKIKQQCGVQASIYDAVPMMMFSVNRYGRAITVNCAAAEAAQKNKLEMLGLLFGEIVGCVNALEPDSCGYQEVCETCVLRQAIVETFETGAPIYKKEGKLILGLENGQEERTYAVTTSLVRVEDGDSALVSLDDITDVKGALERGKQSNELAKTVEELSHKLEEAHLELAQQIEDQKNIEENVSSLLRFHTATMESDGVWVSTLDMKNSVTLWNRAAEKISGYSFAEVVREEDIWEKLFPDPVYRAQIVSWAKADVETVGPLKGIKVTMRHKDGGFRVVSWYANRLFDAKGNRAGSVLLGVDITEDVGDADEGFADGLYFIEFPEPIEVHLPTNEQVKRILRGKVVECNDVLAKWKGFATNDEVIGLPLSQLLSCHNSEDRDLVKSWVELGYRITGAVFSAQDQDGNSQAFSHSIVGVLEKGRLVRMWGTQTKMPCPAEGRESELALRDREWRRACALGHMGYWRLSLQDRVPTWSREVFDLLGFPPETPLNQQTFLAAVHPDDRKFVQQRWKEIHEGRPLQFEYRIVVNGSVRWVAERSTPEVDDRGNLQGAFGILQEITERKSREARLEQVSLAVRHSPFAFDIVDENGRILYVNEACAKMFGLDRRDDLIGSRLEDALCCLPGSPSSQEQQDEGLVNWKEIRCQRRDGSQFQVLRYTRNDTDAVLGNIYHSFSIDLSQWNAKEEKSDLRKAHAMDYELSPHAHLTVETTHGTICYCNPAAAKLFGLNSRDSSGRCLSEFLFSLPARARAGDIMEQLLAGQTIVDEELFLRRTDGTVRQVRFCCYPVGDRTGPYQESRLEIEDITEKKRRENFDGACLRLLQNAIRGGGPNLSELLLAETLAITGSEVGFYHSYERGEITHSIYSWENENTDLNNNYGENSASTPQGVWMVCLVSDGPIVRNREVGGNNRSAGSKPSPVARELVVPLVTGGQVRAVVGVGNKAWDYDDWDVQTVHKLLSTFWETSERLSSASIVK